LACGCLIIAQKLTQAFEKRCHRSPQYIGQSATTKRSPISASRCRVGQSGLPRAVRYTCGCLRAEWFAISVEQASAHHVSGFHRQWVAERHKGGPHLPLPWFRLL